MFHQEEFEGLGWLRLKPHQSPPQGMGSMKKDLENRGVRRIQANLNYTLPRPVQFVKCLTSNKTLISQRFGLEHLSAFLVENIYGTKTNTEKFPDDGSTDVFTTNI